MGGTKTTVQQAPTTPAPSATETAADIFKARLEFDPQIAAQEFGIQQQFQPQQTALIAQQLQQFAPQLAQLQTDIQAGQAPQALELQRELFPQQAQISEALSGQALQRLESPFGFLPGEEAALGEIRERQRGQLQEQLRGRAQLGGGLFGGRAQATEQRALTELEQAFGAEDINRRIQGGQLAQQAALPLARVFLPQIGQPNVPVSPFQFRSTVPSPDIFSQQLFQASQPQQFATPGAPSPLFGLLGTLGGAALGNLNVGPFG